MKFGLDGAYIAYGGVKGYNITKRRDPDLGADCYRDDWGTVYKRNDFSWPIDAPIDYPIKGLRDLRSYKAPDPELPSRLNGSLPTFTGLYVKPRKCQRNGTKW